jgi:hypothetical protein
MCDERICQYAPRTTATRQSIFKIFKEPWQHGLDVPMKSISAGQLELWLASRRAQIKNATYNGDLMLNQAISKDQYRSKKETLLKEKATLKENGAVNRFEPAMRFVKALKQGALHSSEGASEQQSDWLEKVGSNLHLANGTLSICFRNRW